MNAKQKAALIKLLGEEEFNRRMADVGSVNTETDKRKLIFRTTSGDEREDEELDAESFEDIANKTLERIPNNGYYPA